MYNIFNSFIKQPLNSVVSSEAVYNGIDATFKLLDPLTAELFKNDIKVGSTVSIKSGDKIKINFTTPSNYASSTFVKYSINDIIGFFGASTIKNPDLNFSYRTTKFYLNNPNEIVLNTTFSTDPFIINDITTPIEINIPNIMSAKAVLNGAEVGNKATINPGDELKIHFNVTGFSEGEQIVFPFYIGTDVYNVNTFIINPKVKVKPFYFNDISSSALNTLITSNEVEILLTPNYGTDVLTVDGGATIIKNGVDSGQSTNVINNDKIKLKLTSSTEYQTTSYVKVQLGEYRNVWSITTLNDPNAKWIKPEFKNLPIFNAASSSSSIFKITKFNNTTSTTSILDLAGTPTNTHDITADYVYIAGYYNNKLYKIKSDPFELASVYTGLPADSKPASIASVFSAVDEFNSIAITLEAINKVRILKSDLTSFYDLDTGLKPYGNCSSGANLWVANYEGSSVSVYSFNSVTLKYELSTTISIPSSKPYEMFYSETTNLAYVTDILNNKIYALSATEVKATYNVGTNPWGVTANNNYIFTADSYDNTITKIKIADGTITTQKLNYPPVSITIDKENKLYVTNIEDNKVKVYSSEFVYQSEFDTGYLNSWASGSNITTSTGVFVAHVFDDVFSKKIQNETSISTTEFFDSQIDVPRKTFVTSNTITIAGLIRPENLSLEDYQDSSLILNGVEQESKSITVINGDTIAIKIKTPDLFESDFYAAITAKDFRREFHIKTEPKLFPDYMEFIPKYGIVTNETVLSNEITISGISQGYTSTISINTPEAILYKNGSIITDLTSISITNGDVLQLEWTSDMGFSQIKDIILTSHGEDFALFRIFSIGLGDPIRDKVYVNWSLVSYNPMYKIYEDVNNNYFNRLPIKDEKIYNINLGKSLYFKKSENYYSGLGISSKITRSKIINSLIVNLAGYIKANVVYSNNILIPEVKKSSVYYHNLSSPHHVTRSKILTSNLYSPIKSKYSLFYKKYFDSKLLSVNWINLNKPNSIYNKYSCYSVSGRTAYFRSYNSIPDFGNEYKKYAYSSVPDFGNEYKKYAYSLIPNSINEYKKYAYSSVPDIGNDYFHNTINTFMYDPNKIFIVFEQNDRELISFNCYELPKNYLFNIPEYLKNNLGFYPTKFREYSVIKAEILTSPNQKAEKSGLSISQFVTPEYKSLGMTTYYNQLYNPKVNILNIIKVNSSSKIDINKNILYYSLSYIRNQNFNDNIKYINKYFGSDVNNNITYFELQFKFDNLIVFNDTNEYNPSYKGSLTDSEAVTFIAENVEYQKEELSDGTFLYSHPSKEEYGECVNSQYMVEYGLVKGG